MSIVRGGSLENAILRASRAYRRAGKRIVLCKQEPRLAACGVVGQAPVDFLGALDGGAIAIEAKATKGKSLPCSRLRDEQISLCGLLHAAGARVELVTYFSAVDEAFSVAWPEVVTFLALRWRESWSLAWFRAVGQVLVQEGDGSDRAPWLVRFLDASEHPQRAQAIAEVEADRSRPRAAAPDEPIDDPPPPAPSPRTPEQQRAATEECYRLGVENAQRRAARRPGRWPARPRRGGA